MNDDRFGELHAWIEPEIEARIVSLIAGEASDFERDELERLMTERPELRVFRRRLEAVHGLIGESARRDDDDEWKLSEKRRSEVLEVIGSRREGKVLPVLDPETTRERRIRRSGFRVLTMAAACLLLTLIIAPLLISRYVGSITQSEALGFATDAAEGERRPSRSLSAREKQDSAMLERESLRRDEMPMLNDAAVASGLSIENLGGAALAPAVPPSNAASESRVKERLADLRDSLGTFELDFEDPSESAALERGGTVRFKAEPGEGELRLERQPGAEQDMAFGLVEQKTGAEGLGRSAKDLARSTDGTVPAGNEPARPGSKSENIAESAVEEQVEGFFGRRVEGRRGVPQLRDVQRGESLPDSETRPFALAYEEPAADGAITDNFASMPSREDTRWEGREADPFAAPQSEAEQSRLVKRKLAEAPPAPGDAPRVAGKQTQRGLAWFGSEAPDASGGVGGGGTAGGAVTSYAYGMENAAKKNASSEIEIAGSVAVPGQERAKKPAGPGAADSPVATGFAARLDEKVIFSGQTGARAAGQKINQDGLGAALDSISLGVAAQQAGGRGRSEDSADVEWGLQMPEAEAVSPDPAGITNQRAAADSPDDHVVDSEGSVPATGIVAGVGIDGESGRSADYSREFRTATPMSRDGADKALGDRVINGPAPINGGLAKGAALDAELGSVEPLQPMTGVLGELEPAGEVAAGSEQYRRNLALEELKEMPKEAPGSETLRIELEAEARELNRLEKVVKDEQEALAQLEATSAFLEPIAEEAKKRAIVESEVSAAAEPFSTFSLHVSDVSFKLAQASLQQGEWPEAGRIRVEEFVNALDYGDAVPSLDEKVACQIEQAVHPFLQQRNLLRVSMRTAALGRNAGTPLRLTVLLDNSGSMDRADRVEAVQRAFELLSAQMNAQDELTLVSFARTPRLLRDRIPGDKVAELAELIAQTPSEGGTNLEQALRLGMEKARENFVEGAQNRVVLLTDGAANLGNARPAELAEMIEAMRQKGIAFDACGVGAEGLNDEILESLTRKGDGRYYFLDRPEDADGGFARQIAGALRPAARNVKIQVEFNPDRVGNYRLIGFEKHRLEKEDFRNDSIDAAEMAAEEEGVAVYQVETLPEGQGEVGSVSVRFEDSDSGRMVERRWTIPYETNPSRIDEAAASMQLAASAVMLAEKLKGSPGGETVNLRDVLRWTRNLRAVYPDDDRVRQLNEMTEKAHQLTR